MSSLLIHADKNVLSYFPHHRIDFNSMLEKRVASRLNAQYIYMRQPTGVDICKELSARLCISHDDPKYSALTKSQVDR